MNPLLKLTLVGGLILCAALLAVLPGCGEEAQLEGTKWILSSYVAEGTTQDALETPPVDVTFADGNVRGNGGINQYSGTYELDGEILSISSLASTKMAGDPAVMAQESAYLMALQSAALYEIDGDTLILSDGSGGALLEFRPADEA